MARQHDLLREVATHLEGRVVGDTVVLPKYRCQLRLRIVAWRSDDDDIAREWNVRLSSSRETSPSLGGAPYRDVERRVLRGHPAIELQLHEKAENLGSFMDLDKPIKTGDELFDADVYVASDSPRDEVLAALGDAAVRDEIRVLLGAGCARVDINAGGEELGTTIWVGEEAGRIGPIVEGLCRLHAALPRFEGPIARPSRWRQAATNGAFFLPVVGLILSATGVHAWEPVHFTDSIALAAAGLGAWGLLVPIAFFLSRGRPRGGRIFLSVVGPALLGLPLVCFGGAICVNGGLDTREKVIDRARVLGKDASHDDPTITLDVGSSVPLSVDVDAAFLTGLQTGDEVELLVGPGRLGWPWVDGVRKVQKCTTGD